MKEEKIRHYLWCQRTSYSIAAFFLLYAVYLFIDDNFYTFSTFDGDWEIGCKEDLNLFSLLFLIPAIFWILEGWYFARDYYQKMYGITDEDLEEYRYDTE